MTVVDAVWCSWPGNQYTDVTRLDINHNIHVTSPRHSSLKKVSYSYKAHFYFVMAALWYRAGHYIFALWFLSSSIFFFSSPNLSGRRLDVYHTSTHGVALVQI